MADLSIENLVKRFGNFTAVDELDLKVEDGEFIFLLGPSGCGKTTTLRMIAGLEMPTSGRIEIAGRNVTFLRARYRNVGMVFQDYGLYPHMSVYGNIAYPLQVRRHQRAEIRRKVQEVADTMRITDVLDRMPDQLAAGQLQRVAIARMLVRQADIFLMDEPMSHLDAKLRGHMRAELRHIQKKIGTTTLFVTHDQLEAMTMADRIMVMNCGKVLQFATPLEIFERPADEFVATFVGEPHMNVFDVRLTRANGRSVADAGSFAVTLEEAWVLENGLAAYEGHKLRLGIRPEHMRVAPAQSEAHPVGAALFSFEPTGPEDIVVAKAGEVELTVRTSASGMAGLPTREGAPLALGFDPRWIYLFDGETGKTVAQARASLSAREKAA